MNTNFFNRVYEVVKRIPKGKVATYGQIADALNSPRMARQVGWALHVNPQPGVIPCHRVVNHQGRLAPGFAFGGSDVQKHLLEAEGIIFDNPDIIDLKTYVCSIEDLLG